MVRRYVPTYLEIEAALEFARNTTRYTFEQSRDAHDVFTAVRRKNLQLGTQDSLTTNILRLAEKVAKLTYNARGYPAPFDHDAAWHVAEDLKKIVNQVNDSDFAATAWSTFVCEKYIQLDSGIRCNPYCSLVVSFDNL